MRIREVKTASGKRAVQVISKRYGKLTVHKHIGSYADELEKKKLYLKARAFIKKSLRQISFKDCLTATSLRDIEITQSQPLLTYQLLSNSYDKLGLNQYPDEIIKDLVIARVYRPASKRGTQVDLDEFFGKKHSLKTIYRHLKQALDSGIKQTFQQALVNFSRYELKDSLRLVFYDVTTLYFDSRAKTKLRNFGFSKDHKHNKVQVVVGLVVNKQGFPLYFDVFEGNTFEGHTLIKTVKNIQKLLNCSKLTVVADSAMLSRANLALLDSEGIGFIVGARMGNLSLKLINQISSSLAAKDKKTITIDYCSYRLICQYSKKRANKDRSDRNRQIKKAQSILTAPSRFTNRYRFIKKSANSDYRLNQELINKAAKLEGIKGYITNTYLSEEIIIIRYHDLWKVEKSFRLTKTDLKARPIFHRLDQTIKAHLMIVFASLAICKYIEITTGKSIQKVLRLTNKILTHKVTNIKTGEVKYLETTIHDPKLKQEITTLKKLLGH
jgi:transposase